MNHLGVGIKIPLELLQANPTLLEQWIEHFRNHSCFWIVGKDTNLMVEPKAHYHLHLITIHTKEQIMKRREKFKLKLGKTMKVYYSKKMLNTAEDMFEWLGYAIKEEYISHSDGKTKETATQFDFKLSDITPYALCAKKKKENLLKGEQKNILEKKELRDKKELILEFLKNNVADYTLSSIYECLVNYQRQKDDYLENFYMTRIAHIFVQKHSNLSSMEIVNLRFRHI